MQIFAEEICYKLKGILSEKEEIQGTVHSVFNRVCNIAFDNMSIVSLISGNIPMKPMAISIKSSVNMPIYELGIEAGQKVKYHHNKIEIYEADFILNLEGSREIDCSPFFGFDRLSASQVDENISKLRETLVEGSPMGLLPIVSRFEEAAGKQNNPIPQNRYSEFAWPRVNKLIEEIIKVDTDEIVKASRGIAGFGPGLTPSSDDMLIGIMTSLIYASNYYSWDKDSSEAINEAILKGAEGRTNQLSYEMMCYASKGEVIKNIHQLMACIYFSTDKLLHKCAKDVMNYGETSGADLLSGIYIGCNIYRDLNLIR